MSKSDILFFFYALTVAIFTPPVIVLLFLFPGSWEAAERGFYATWDWLMKPLD